jgi:hypothetical protein
VPALVTSAFVMHSDAEIAVGAANIETTIVSASTSRTAARTTPPTTTLLDHVPRVAYFGDSIAVEAEPHVAALLRERGLDYWFEGYGGTATCDYLDEMRATAAAFEPDVVVIQFTGNALTPCILARTGGGRGILGGDATFDIFGFAVGYGEDTAAAIEAFGPDVDVLLLGVIPTREGVTPPAQIVNDIYRRLAEERENVAFLMPDELLAPDGVYAHELPCTFVEPCTPGDPVPVRAEDGGHLCPTSSPQFCFGGLRMALTIVDAVDAGLPPAPRRAPLDE